MSLSLEMPKPDEPFRVIVIGAGIAGLSLAHALQRARVEHIVLEKHTKIASPHGAVVVMWPHIARIMDQFGCLDDLEKLSGTVHNEHRRTANGRAIARPQVNKYLEDW